MKKRLIEDFRIKLMNHNDIINLTEKEIVSLTVDQCYLFSYDQLDWFKPEQLSYFTSIQKKCLSINIITKSIEDIQKININALSDVELKSLLRHQIEELTYDQIVNILPYVHHMNKISLGTIGNFRPKQYSFFKLKQLKWLTMYQSANIPKNYLSIEQIKVLPPMCYDFPQDTFLYFIHKNDIENYDCKNMTHNEFKYISKYTLQMFSEEQINEIPKSIYHNVEMIKKLKLLSKKQFMSLQTSKYKI
jgi:hypothetical protein